MIRRYALRPRQHEPRELRVSRTATDLIVLAVHGPSGCTSGPLGIVLADLAALRAALADVANEIAAERCKQEPQQ